MFSYSRPENPYHAVDLPLKKRTVPITGACKISLNQPLELIITDGYHTVRKLTSVLAEPAIKTPLNKERVMSQLEKTGETPFVFKSLEVLLEEGCSVPIKEINALRRSALEALASSRIEDGRRRPSNVQYSFPPRTTKTLSRPQVFISVETEEQAKTVAPFASKLFLPVDLWDRRCDFDAECVLIIPRFADKKRLSSFQEGRLAAAGWTNKCGYALFGDLNIHTFQCLMVAVPQAHIFYRDHTHKLLLFLKCFCTSVAAKLIRTVRTIRMAAMAKATPNSPCSFA